MAKQILIFGGLLLDRYIYIDRWPKRGEDGFIQKENSFVGGCAVNMAVTAHNLCADNNEIEVHVVSAIGKDAVAKEILSYMEAHHLSTKYVFEQDGQTGSCMVFSEPDGERTFLTQKGVEEVFPTEISQEIVLGGADAIGLTGYYLLGKDAKRILQCIQSLKEQGAFVLFDPSPLVGDIPEEYLRIAIELADMMTPNQSELASMKKTGLLNEEILAQKMMVYKDGAQGGRLVTPQEAFSFASASCRVVDTTGAGDSFSGALLFAIVNKMDKREMIRLAAECAAHTVESEGPHAFWK